MIIIHKLVCRWLSVQDVISMRVEGVLKLVNSLFQSLASQTCMKGTGSRMACITD